VESEDGDRDGLGRRRMGQKGVVNGRGGNREGGSVVK